MVWVGPAPCCATSGRWRAGGARSGGQVSISALRRLGWFVAGFGVAAAAASRLFRGAPAPAPPPVEEGPDPRADELRQRIAESRELVDEREEFEQAETPVDEADPDARRRAVHERGRAAAERMRGE